MLLTTLRNLLVLGSETVNKLYFQSTMAVGLITLGLLERLELTVMIVFLVCVFIKISICIFVVCNGISKVFVFDDYKFIATPVALLMLSFSMFCFQKYHGNIPLDLECIVILFIFF
ncbi:GerAB/ArcD/ProY family transporter [Clostridium estertheticum]|uniref:GerAB/ArcD/ProY family transporter n=1 Tax=Clostridium estertheticum TaxID=238834 RepID=UPI00227A92D6|nr:GerAB/ArcD/ProY family transporter [Clostridium estertheticum]